MDRDFLQKQIIFQFPASAKKNMKKNGNIYIYICHIFYGDTSFKYIYININESFINIYIYIQMYFSYISYTVHII